MSLLIELEEFTDFIDLLYGEQEVIVSRKRKEAGEIKSVIVATFYILDSDLFWICLFVLLESCQSALMIANLF